LDSNITDREIQKMNERLLLSAHEIQQLIILSGQPELNIKLTNDDLSSLAALNKKLSSEIDSVF